MNVKPYVLTLLASLSCNLDCRSISKEAYALLGWTRFEKSRDLRPPL